MQFEDSKKADILISALEERYNSMHKIRDRVQGIGIWALGLMLGAGGWLIQSDAILTNLQKAIGILGVSAAFAALRFYYLRDLQIGFKAQQRTAARLEDALGLFSPGFLDKSDMPMFPESWKNSGTAEGDGGFFASTHVLLYVGVIFLILVTLLNGCAL